MMMMGVAARRGERRLPSKERRKCEAAYWARATGAPAKHARLRRRIRQSLPAHHAGPIANYLPSAAIRDSFSLPDQVATVPWFAVADPCVLESNGRGGVNEGKESWVGGDRWGGESDNTRGGLAMRLAHVPPK